MINDDGGLFAGSLPGSPAFRRLHSWGCRCRRTPARPSLLLGPCRLCL